MRSHADPEVLAVNRRIREGLSQIFGPGTVATGALPGSGTLGMETGLANLVRRKDPVLILTNGAFGDRMAEIAPILGLEAHVLRFAPGEAVDLAAVRDELSRREVRLVAMVHGETSTGVLNPAREVGALAKEYGALYMLDVVTTAAMMPLSLDALGVDYAFTGSQKCLSAPPGLAPFALSARGRAALGAAQSWYMDLERALRYWEEGGYHVTVPVLLHYALAEALALALDEGLEARETRARTLYRAVLEVLEGLGFEAFPKGSRLPTVLVVEPPRGYSEETLVRGLRELGVVVAGGIGPTRGKVLRLGLMGEGARAELYVEFFRALGRLMRAPRLAETFSERLAARSEAALRSPS